MVLATPPLSSKGPMDPALLLALYPMREASKIVAKIPSCRTSGGGLRPSFLDCIRTLRTTADLDNSWMELSRDSQQRESLTELFKPGGPGQLFEGCTIGFDSRGAS